MNGDRRRPEDDVEEARTLRALWDELGIPGAVDVHTHFMPPSVMQAVWRYFDSAGPLVGRQWPIAYRESEQKRVDLLRSFGIRRFSSMVYPHKPDMAAWLNSWAADFAARTPDCLQTATFYPEAGAPEYVSQAIASGASVFKAHVQVGDYDPADPLLDQVWGALEDAQVPTVIHAGSGPVAGRFTGPAPIAKVLRQHPRLPLIVAHLGMPEYDAFFDLAQRYESVWLDTTMNFTAFTDELLPMSPGGVARLADLQERIMFGSDFPNIPYPYVHAVESVVRLELGESWLRDVFHDNAARLWAVP